MKRTWGKGIWRWLLLTNRRDVTNRYLKEEQQRVKERREGTREADERTSHLEKLDFKKGGQRCGVSVRRNKVKIYASALINEKPKTRLKKSCNWSCTGKHHFLPMIGTKSV